MNETFAVNHTKFHLTFNAIFFRTATRFDERFQADDVQERRRASSKGTWPTQVLYFYTKIVVTLSYSLYITTFVT